MSVIPKKNTHNKSWQMLPPDVGSAISALCPSFGRTRQGQMWPQVYFAGHPGWGTEGRPSCAGQWSANPSRKESQWKIIGRWPYIVNEERFRINTLKCLMCDEILRQWLPNIYVTTFHASWIFFSNGKLFKCKLVKHNCTRYSMIGESLWEALP